MGRKRLFITIPKISIWIGSLLVSVQLCAGMVVGYLVARFCSGKNTSQPGKVRSITFSVRNYRFHLHHWLICAALIAVAFLNDISFSLFYGFLGGLIYQGVFYYNDWYKVLTRRKK